MFIREWRWLFHSTIWNDDDCIAVKEAPPGQCSENMLFERINASGVGLTIGSIGPSTQHTCVRNITFRDSIMANTFKGIYIKSRPGDSGNPLETAEISDVLYQNITILNPTQWCGRMRVRGWCLLKRCFLAHRGCGRAPSRFCSQGDLDRAAAG